MWSLVRRLREGGVTIILTTHYIDEAEEMADRIGVVDKDALGSCRGLDVDGHRRVAVRIGGPPAVDRVGAGHRHPDAERRR